MTATVRSGCVLALFISCVVVVESATNCNNLKADIVFVLDASEYYTSRQTCTDTGWIWGRRRRCRNIVNRNSNNFLKAKTFINNFVDLTKDYINPRETRIGVVTFDNAGTASAHLSLSDNSYFQNVKNSLSTISSQAPSATDTSGGLQAAKAMLNSNAARADSSHLVVLLTDGKKLLTTTQPVAADLKSSGKHLMTVTVVSVGSAALNRVSGSSDFLHQTIGSSTPGTAFNQLVQLACIPLCAWDQDPCFPGSCGTHNTVADCQCAPGFKRTSHTDKRCQLDVKPDLTTCRVTLKDANGNEVRSRTSGTLQKCSSQQHEFMNIQPTNLTYELDADFRQSIGTLPSHVSRAGVGMIGFKLKIVVVSVSGSERVVKEQTLNQSPVCSQTVSITQPASVLECASFISVSNTSPLTDGEKLCVDMTALGGGYYNRQDESQVSKGTVTLPQVSTSRRLCFTYDGTKPVHCSQTPGASGCSGSLLELSTRLTRSPDIRVAVGGWVDPVPRGVPEMSVSKIAKYYVEVHDVHVSTTSVVVQEASASRKQLTGNAPYDVSVTLPATEPGLYAVILEVHDVAGNVAYARRLVLYDNSSRVVLNPAFSLKVVSANPLANHRWQTDFSRDVCLEWKDRFYNDAFFHANYFLPVSPERGREIAGVYDQTTGTFPVSGTPSVRGIVKFETSWGQEGSAQGAWLIVHNFTTQSTCFPSLTLRDGSTYNFDVRATDIMSRSITDDVTLHADSSGPELRELGLKGGKKNSGVYVHSSTDLSTMVLVIEASDPHSGIKTLRWTLEEEGGSGGALGTRAVSVQRLGNGTSCGSETHCYCPAVGQCEIYRYQLTFNSLVDAKTHTADHHRNYHVTLNATNWAGLFALDNLNILIDASPPTVGVALEGQDDLGEVDFTREATLHVRWHGFRDEESGVEEFRVVVSRRCLSLQEVEEAVNAVEVSAGSALRATFTLPSEGRYFTNVVAYNGANAPSPVACSDGVVYDTSAPRLFNVSIAHAHSARALACTSAETEVTWLVSSGLTKTRLSNTSKCAEVCSQAGALASVDHFPIESSETLSEAESDELCRSLPMMTEDWWIALPSDRLRVTWASEEKESAIEDFYVGAGSSRTSTADLLPMTSTHRQHVLHNSRSGLGHGTVFYLFLRAVNKAGSSTDLVLGPIVVDNTPPRVTNTLTTTMDGKGHLRVVWTQADIVDPEQPAGIDLEVTYRIGHSDGYITQFQRMNKSGIAVCQEGNSNITGCLRVSVDTLRAHDAGTGRPFFFQLHVQNAAGLITTVNSSSLRLPPRENHVIVIDILPWMATESAKAVSDVIKDVDVVLEPSSLCAAWTEFANQHDATHVQIHFGVGRDTEIDDVIPFSPVDASNGRACINASALPLYEKIYSLVRIRGQGSSSVHSSDGLIIIPRSDPQNAEEVFTGKGCSRNDLLHEEVLTIQTSAREVNVSAQLTFHSGDELFIEFQPYVANIQFPGAYIVQATLTGYQVILRNHVLSLRVPGGASSSTTVRVYSCLKDDLLWRKQHSLTASWDLSGPASRFANSLEVEVLDQTCLKKSAYEQDKLACSVAKSHFIPSSREATFKDLALVTDHSYTTSVAMCCDECLPGAVTAEFTVITEQTVVKLDSAQIVSQAEGSFKVNITAAIEPENPGHPCYFLWSVSRTNNGSRLLSDWQLREEVNCDNIEINAEVNFVGTPHGSLYACIQPMHPHRAVVPTCRKMARSIQVEEEQIQTQPFHIIEMSQSQLQEMNVEGYLILQHADDQLHNLYDLDLDFTGSDVVVAALLTNSVKHTVTWFLVTAPRVPDEGDCDSDSSCVDSSSSSNATVVFPSYRASLQSGEVYFVCALLSPLQSTENALSVHEVCGDGFLVDDHPPSAGTVSILNTNDGFLSNEHRVLVSWSGFQDALEERGSAYGVASLSYSVTLGSYPGGEDLASRVSVGKRTLWTFHDLHLVPGTDCYATVTARDMVGHVTSSSSKAAVFDNTPPSKGKVTLQSYTGDNSCVKSSQLHVRWEAIADPESGIASQEVSVGVHSDGHQNDVNTVTPFSVVRGHSVKLNLSAVLVDGHSYVILMKSTNGAGLATLTSSEPFIADNSPPVIGTEWVNISGSSETDQTNQYEYTAQWSGFADPHCGLAYYRVGLGSNPAQDDVVSLHYVGLRTSYRWKMPLESGKEYFAMVEACNHAGLCGATSSSGFLVDHTPPSSGHVTVGTNERHSPFWGHNTFLEAHWNGFFDSQSGIREFLWCVGRSPGSCDVMPMTSAQRERVGIASGVSLPSAVPLYVTVVAENYAGLRTSRTSSKFIVDVSPPSPASAPTFLSPSLGTAVTAQSDPSVVKLSWRFTDPGSSVVTHTLSINGHRHGRHGSEPLVVMVPGSHVTLPLDKESLLSDGDVYTASVTACNAADLCTSAVSAPLLVDSSPPIVGKFDSEMSWRVRAVNDYSGNFSHLATEINIVWTDFADEESGIRGYHLTAGRSYSSDELSDGVVFVSHNNVSSTQTFPLSTRETLGAGDLLVFSLRAENNVGLISPVKRMTFEVFVNNAAGDAGTLLLQRHSCAPHYCSNECTCAPSGQPCQPSGPAAQCRDLSNDPRFSNLDLAPRFGCPSCDLDFTTSATCLEGHWTLPDLDSSTSVSRFQWSFSLAGKSPGVGVFDIDSKPAWYDAGLRTSATYCLPYPNTLSLGSSYVLHMRAWLSRDSYVTQTSLPVVVDDSAPARRRGRSVIESVDPSCSGDVDFFLSDRAVTSLTACWNGVFTDEESGIQNYAVWIGTVPYSDDYQREQNLQLSTTTNMDMSSMLEGTHYYVTVRATNGAGLTSTLTSDGVMKDVTSPVTGAVYASSRHAVHRVTDDNTKLSASWHGFNDLESGVTSYSVALFDADDLTTPVVDFQETQLKRTHIFDNLPLTQGHEYKVAVKATNAAGLTSPSAWSPAILVDVTPPQGITCIDFQLAAQETLTFTSTSSFQHEQYHVTLPVNVPAESHLLKVLLTATSLRPGGLATVTLDDVTMPLVFDFAFLNQSSAQHVLMAPGEGQREVSVLVYGNAGAVISAQVFTCSQNVVSDANAVTLEQVSPRTLSICTTVVDKESSLKSLKIGVGSTPGGLQVKPWTLAGQSGHLLLTDLSHVQQAGPLYAVVLAQNHAGAWSRFVSSKPVMFDTTPPVISGVNVTLTYGDSVQGGGNMSVTAVAVWTAVDDESGGVTCTCSIVGQQTSDDVTQLRNDVTPGNCQWRLTTPRHGSSVHAVISCRNQVDISSTKSSEQAIVLMQPPDVTKASLYSVYNYDHFSPYDRPESTFRSSDSDIMFTWTGVDDPTVEKFQYRFLLNSAPVTGWSPSPPYKTAAILPKSDGRTGNVTAEVRALNRKALASEVLSAEVILNDQKPSLTGMRAAASILNNTLHLDWAGVFSTDRDATFAVYAGTLENSGDVINHYVTRTTSYAAPCNPSLQQLYLNIQCIYSNGLFELYEDKLSL